MWLTGQLAPDFKTIADFRKDNGMAIRAVCAQFIGLCRRLKLFTHAVVAIDGSKFKAVNNRDKNSGRMEQIAPASPVTCGRWTGLTAKGRCRRGQVGPSEREDCRPTPADAGPAGDGADRSGRARPAGLADQSRRPV